MSATENELALAKRLRAEGHHALALEHAIAALDDPGGDQVAASMLAAELSLELGRPHEALSWAGQARDVGAPRCRVDRIEVVCRLEMSQARPAAQLLDAAERHDDHDDHDDCETCRDHGWVTLQRARIALIDGRWQQAFDCAQSVAREEPNREAAWRALAVAAVHHPHVGDVEGLLAVLGTDQLSVLATCPAAGVDRLLEAFWAASPGDVRLVALLEFTGGSMELGDALKWSDRLRDAGFRDSCPTLGLAANQERPASLRVTAAGAAFAAFGDARAEPLLALAVSRLAPQQIPEAFRELRSLAPDLIEGFVTAAATDTRRCVITAELLGEPATAAFGLVLLDHAIAVRDGGPTVQSLSQHMDPTRRGCLQEAAACAGREDLLATLG
jgi:tetratricopeptide (TPR) repeat protein